MQYFLLTTVLVDATASWDVNEYVGQLLQVQSAGTVGSAVTRELFLIPLLYHCCYSF
jgi:hypothetical protein